MAGEDIILCDDEPELLASLAEFLRSRGFGVHCASDGAALADLLDEVMADLIVLDVRMPKVDGITALRAIRKSSQVPIIVLTAVDDSVDRIVGLELGADDYVGKPIEPRELEARIRAVLRRTADRERSDKYIDRSIVRLRGLRLDLGNARLLSDSDHEILLTAGEFAILRKLVENQGRILSRDQLLSTSLLTDDEPFDRSIDLRVSRLRKKLTAAGATEIIRTVRGLGYVID